jgi:hypothetical protein
MNSYVANFRGHPSSFATEIAPAGSLSFDFFAQDFIMAKTSTTSSRNLPVWEVSISARQKAQAQGQDRDSSLAVTRVWEMARTSPPKPTKLGIYLLECSKEEQTSSHSSALRTSMQSFEDTAIVLGNCCKSSALTEKPR